MDKRSKQDVKKDSKSPRKYALVPKEIADDVFEKGRYASFVKKW
jgi:hypothetical protein